jgi:hypothetical protein
VAVLGWLWLGSPFALIAIISNDPELLAMVSRHLKRCRVIGCTGAASMLLGVMLVPGALGDLMFVVGTPLSGLMVWASGNDGDDGGEQPPDVPPIDWDDFERALLAPSRGRSGPPRRPRAPSAR